MRSPLVIAAEARFLVDSSSKAFVPAPIVRLGELSIEFMESVAVALDSAGLIPPKDSVEVMESVAAALDSAGLIPPEDSVDEFLEPDA